MARSMKDESAFNNWERDIKNINKTYKEDTSGKLSFPLWKRQVEDTLAKQLKLDNFSPRLQGYMERAKAIFANHYEKQTLIATVVKEIIRDYEPQTLGFSHANAHLWTKNGISVAPVIEAPKKKPRKKKETPTNESNEESNAA